MFKNVIPSEVSSISMIISNANSKIISNKFRINPKTPQDAWNKISNKIISLFELFDDKIKIKEKGKNSKIEPLNVKDIIISYLKSNSFGSEINIPLTTLERINWIVENDQKGMMLFNEIKINNPILFNKINKISDKADTAAVLGGLGF